MVVYPLANPELQRRIKDMKQLLSGVAIVAALSIAAPVWAQRTGPGVGAPGPNQPVPGGPGPSSPLSNLPASPSRDAPYPGAPPAAAMPGSMGDTRSAVPPARPPARHAGSHYVEREKQPPSTITGTTATRLNEESQSRLQAGNFPMPPAPPPPEATSASNTRGPGRQIRREMQR